MSGAGKWLRAALCWGLCLALQTALFWNVGRFAWLDGGVSLRYAEPLTLRQTERAQETARETRAVDALTFWTEQSGVEVSANGREERARLLAVCGDAARVTAGRMLSGTPPAAPGGCAISGALAWRLWGALDVTGLELTAGERRYSVTGVFEDEALCLIAQNAADEAPYDNVELCLPGPDASRGALSFARAGGLGAPAYTMDGGALAALAGLMCRMPLALGALVLLARFARGLSPRAKRRLAYAALLAFALCLPRLLAALPAAWIPTRWSDFSFWQELARSAADGVDAWLALPPQSVDVAAKKLLLCQGALCAAGCAAVWGALCASLRYSVGRMLK